LHGKVNCSNHDIGKNVHLEMNNNHLLTNVVTVRVRLLRNVS
jgi:hypothetical protein